MKSKFYYSLFISLCLLAITITPAFATLPNESVFNWVGYKFPDLFPNSAIVKSELTHEGVHYDLRSWSGSWGTRYLGITDDGEIFGLGDYTENELKSFGYIDDWEDSINADWNNVYDQNTSVSYVVSPTPNYPVGYAEPMTGALGGETGVIFTSGMDGRNHVLYFGGNFTEETLWPGYDFVETSSDVYEVFKEYSGITPAWIRDWQVIDTERTDIKRVVIADSGPETDSRDYNSFPFGDVWVATDYGDGFEFEVISQWKGFYHTLATNDIDDDGDDDVMVLKMGIKGIDGYELDGHIWDLIFTYTQLQDDEFEQVVAFNNDRDSNGDDEMQGGGAILFVDLDNDGDDELVQANYVIENEYYDWGAFKVWKMDNNGKYSIVHTQPKSWIQDISMGDDRKMGCSRIVTIDYNHDGFDDLLLHYEGYLGATGVELYVNNGDMTFDRVSDEAFTTHLWGHNELYAHEELVVDVNNDGWDDIVFQAGGGENVTGWRYDLDGDEWWEQYQYCEENGYHVNFGSMVFINNQGDGFIRQSDNPALTMMFEHEDDYPGYFRVIGTTDGVTKLFGFRKSDGAPMVFNLRFE